MNNMRKKQNAANKNKCKKAQRLWPTLAHKKQKPNMQRKNTKK
jgi:hypothetical protein